MTEAYPLEWPLGWPRTPKPTRAIFQTSLAGARDGLLYELRLMNATDIVINSNMALWRDGLPDVATVATEPWYEVLNVPFDAGPAVIRRAFAELAKKHHPDVGGDPAEFERIKKAYKEAMS